MKLVNLIKRFSLYIIFYIFLFEILFQAMFFFNFNFIKQPLLFYNGYCDQKYWNLYNKKTKISENIRYHPILTYSKKDLSIPDDFLINENPIIKDLQKNNISLYGSSYLNHQSFKGIINNIGMFKIVNYSLESYGLDQIFLSYKLTSYINQNKTIVFGFLLEDLDRSIFKYRDYEKAVFISKNNEFNLSNIPIKENNKPEKVNDFYLYKFLANFYNLITNDFDPRKSECLINHKKKLFDYFFTEVMNDAKKYNQKIIVITFNLKEDIINKPSWRYNYIKNYLKQKKITHIDALEILKNASKKHDENIVDYFASDNHNNKKSFQYIVDEFIKLYK